MDSSPTSFQRQMDSLRRHVGRTLFEQHLFKRSCPFCGKKSWCAGQNDVVSGGFPAMLYEIECQECNAASSVTCRVPWSVEAVITTLFLRIVSGEMRVAERLRGKETALI